MSCEKMALQKKAEINTRFQTFIQRKKNKSLFLNPYTGTKNSPSFQTDL